MKSFKEFYEQVSLIDLRRQYSQSSEGKREARMSATQRAREESSRRRKNAKEFTKRHRENMLAKRKK